jgi:hypothetical protein
MNFDYKHSPIVGAGMITNLFQPANILTAGNREEFNIPTASRHPELAALHVVSPADVDESFHEAGRKEGYLILRRPMIGDTDKSPEIEGVYKQSDAKRDDSGWKFLLKPLESKQHYQIHINTQFPHSNVKIKPRGGSSYG